MNEKQNEDREQRFIDKSSPFIGVGCITLVYVLGGWRGDLDVIRVVIRLVEYYFGFLFVYGVGGLIATEAAKARSKDGQVFGVLAGLVLLIVILLYFRK